MKFSPFLILLSLTLASCSGSKSAQNVSQETPQIELSDADEFIENPNEEPVADGSDIIETNDVTDTTIPSEVMEEPVVADANIVEEKMVGDGAPVTPVISEMAGSEKMYTVQKNETLMLVAFKLYGDYERWKELANYNRDTLKGSVAVREGMQLKYMAPAEEFVWNPEGLPYLIRTGDTLGGISANVYQTPKKWKMIWDNNRPLIKDPNRIFAGFTIYYLENGREVASEN